MAGWYLPEFVAEKVLEGLRGDAHSGKGQGMGLAWAIADILTPANFAIAIMAALVGYIVLEFLPSKF